MANREAKRTFRTDSDGLAVAKKIAELIDGSFDEKQTRETADLLHQTYFEEIRKVLGPKIVHAQFEAASLRLVNAFARAPSDEPETIFFDEQLDFWIMTCTHLTAVAACKALDGEHYKVLVDLFIDSLSVPADPFLHELFRPRFKSFLFEHHDCLELSHALSRAMIVFVILHELGHVVLGHARLQPDPTQEFQADELALSYFLKVVDAGSGAGLIFVHHKLVAAPALLMRFLELLEAERTRRTHRPPSRTSHPAPHERYARLKKLLAPRLNEQAAYVFDGFMVTSHDMAIAAGLEQ